MTANQKEVWVKCEPCRHVWIAAHLSMSISEFVKVMGNLVCPECGAGGTKILLAKESDIPMRG